jgi:hypothetical protein
MAKAPTSKLSALKNRFELGSATDGQWLPLLDIFKDPLGLAVKVLSIDTDEYVRARTKALGKYAKKSEKWRKDNLDDIIAGFMARAVVVDWFAYDPDGDEPNWSDRALKDPDPYDPEVMTELLTHKPTSGRNTALEQIDLFVSDASNFRISPDLGKSETI